MAVDRALAQAQLFRDLPVGAAPRNQAQHVELANGQRILRAGVREGRRRFETGQIGPCPESFEDGPRRLVLELVRLLVAEGSARVPDEDTHTCRLVGRPEPLPELERIPERLERRVRAAFGEGDRAVGLRNHRAQHVGVERLRQRSQFIASAPGVFEIGDRQQDFELRRQEPGAPQPIAGRARQPADGRARGAGASLRQPQQRESGLRIESQVAGGAIGALRLLEFAAETMNLRLLIERRTRRPAIGAPGAFTGAAGLGQRVRPRPLELHDLGAMHQAHAGERHHVGLLLAHARKRGSPFAGAPQGIDLPAGVDHAAVHRPRHDRRQLACDDGEHRLVQALEAAYDVALLDERAALRVARRCREIRVSKGLADRGGAACGRMRQIGSPLAQLLLGDRDGQITLLGAVVARDGPLAPRRPGVRAAGLATQQEGDREPECTPRGAPPVVGPGMETIEAFENSRKLDVAAGQIRRRCQAVEIIGFERGCPIRRQESLVGVAPRAAPVTRSAFFKLIHLEHARTRRRPGSCS